MQDDFGIGFRAEDVTVGFKLASEIVEIINFPIEDDPYRFFDVGHGLMSASQIDDGEPAKAEPQWTVEIVAFVIRPAMSDRRRHGLKGAPFDWR